MIFKKKRFFERRRDERRKGYCLIKYRPLHKGEPFVEVLTSLRDISRNGILFKSREYLPADTRLEVKVNLPPMEKPIATLAKVMRFEKIGRKRGYWIGITFLDIKEEDRKKIVDFVASQTKPRFMERTKFL